MSDTDVDSRGSFLRGVLRGVIYGVLALVVTALVAAVILPRLLGAVPLTVVTGSMKPTINPGAIVVSQKVKPADVHIGDIVTYQAELREPGLITHRVTGITYGISGIDHFTTQGDANGAPDRPVVPEQVKGRYIYQIPYLGHVTHLVPVTVKPYIAQAGGAALILWGVVQVILSRSRRQAQTIEPTTPKEETRASS